MSSDAPDGLDLVAGALVIIFLLIGVSCWNHTNHRVPRFEKPCKAAGGQIVNQKYTDLCVKDGRIIMTYRN